ncbi:MAG TPA: hypothetical protein VHL11_02795 [Phototrophicaceae bacterium]|jgi:hypothetical protein|nr:hypothetical protein [Phototrophicaceae bacterium]
MIDIEFDIEAEGESPDPLLCEREIEALLDNTRAQVRQHIQKRVGDLVCDEHGQSPKILVSGTYDLETEQIELSYNVDACCNRMTMQAATLLSRM